MSFSQQELEKLRNQVYQGYITKSVPRWEYRGAGDGRSLRQVGYKDVISYDAYKMNDLWKRVADEVGVGNVNSTNDIRKLYDYVTNYSAPQPVAEQPVAQQPADAPVAPTVDNTYIDRINTLESQLANMSQTNSTRNTGQHTSAWDPRPAPSEETPDFAALLEEARNDFNKEIGRLATEQEKFLGDLQIQQNDRLQKMAADQKAAADKIAVGQRTYQQNLSRSGVMGALQIGGASTTPRAGGTQGFKRRKLQINPVTANALSGILGGTDAVNQTNVLNV